MPPSRTCHARSLQSAAVTVPRARLLLAASLLAVPVFVPRLARAAPQPVACVPANATFGAAELVCAIPPQMPARLLRFQLTFGGVHDDSSAGMAARLDGAPVKCTQESRPQFRGEAEGDTLSCVLPIDPAGAARELRLQLVWYHAEPGDYTLRAE